MKKNLEDSYDNTFYSNQVNASLKSASVILKVLFDLYIPKSILDIGCGHGTWLYQAQKLGASTLHGIDGPWVSQADMLSNEIQFTPANMEVDVPIDRKYDLSMSVEVAEHLSKSCAPRLVSSLCSASDVVLFGAAVICQGGENHINEQRQSYWVNRFLDQGYRHFDIFRPKIWGNRSVCPWYRQNTFLFVRQDREDLCERFILAAQERIIDIIHPEMFENRVLYYRNLLSDPTFRDILGLVKSYVQSKI
jgi:hypothetical protein